jgi:Family of unknown function (DUF6788)
MLLKKEENDQFQSLRSYRFGHIQKRRVRCGKLNCKCARGRGFLHTAFYRAWDEGGVRYRKYVPRDEVESMRELCESYRALKIEMRAFRKERKAIHDHLRGLERIFRGK